MHIKSNDLPDSYFKSFFEQGYFLVEGLFNDDEIEEIKAAFERLQTRAAKIKETTIIQGTQFVVEDNAIHRIVWCCGLEPGLDRFAMDPRLTKPASKVLNSREMDQLICQAHFKMPGDGVAFPWHQDTENRGYGTSEWKDLNGTGSYIQTLTAIDPVTTDNSPLLVLPGSNQRGHLALNEGDNRAKFVDESQLIPVIMDPGSTLFFSPYLIHGSGTNESDLPRRVFINGYAFPGSNLRVYPGAGLGRRFKI